MKTETLSGVTHRASVFSSGDRKRSEIDLKFEVVCSMAAQTTGLHINKDQR